MELYEAINKRKTTREFLNKEVDFEVIKRISQAGNKAPLGITTYFFAFFQKNVEAHPDIYYRTNVPQNDEKTRD